MSLRSCSVICCLVLIGVLGGCVTTKEDDNPLTAGQLVDMGRTLYDGMQYSGAANFFRQALDRDPNHLEANLGLGYCYFMLAGIAKQRQDTATRNQYEHQAMNYFRKASQLKPDDPRSYLAAGTLKHGGKRWEEAIKPLTMALERAPADDLVTRERCYFYLGTCHAALGVQYNLDKKANLATSQYKEARQYYLKILDIPNAPSRAEAEKMLIEIDKALSSIK